MPRVDSATYVTTLFLGVSPHGTPMQRLIALFSMAEGLQAVLRTAETETKLKPKVLMIAGTTAVGKTDLSLELAKMVNGEVISADSVQVYRHMNIGSAKATPTECSGVPHHLLNVASVTDEIFSVGDYYELASKALEEVIGRGRLPLVVGGTGLYLQTLMQGLSGAPPSSREGRDQVDALLEEDMGKWEVSLSRLSALDPEYAASLSPNDWYRLKRALEICTASGKTVTSFKKIANPEDSPYDFRCLFLAMPRVQLFQRIDTRCEAIIEQGLFQEVVSLVCNEGLVLDSQAGHSIGYRQALEYLSTVWGFPHKDGRGHSLQIPREDLRKSFFEFLADYKTKTRQLARRQLVWFKKNPSFLWLNMAPGGRRLDARDVAKGVEGWLINGTPIPDEWQGEDLKELTGEEKGVLLDYQKLSQPVLFADEKRVDSVLRQIETSLSGQPDSDPSAPAHVPKLSI